MSAAELALWTRRRIVRRARTSRRRCSIRRDIVKTSAMRLTLHLIPARDSSMVIAALRPMATATLGRCRRCVGATPAHVRAMIDAVVDALGDGPRTQQELVARARKTAGTGVRAWLDHAWSAVRPAVVDGLIVYGPPRGAEATFVRVDAWLPAQPSFGVDEARAALLRRFLSAFGPGVGARLREVVGAQDRDALCSACRWSPLRRPDRPAGHQGRGRPCNRSRPPVGRPPLNLVEAGHEFRPAKVGNRPGVKASNHSAADNAETDGHAIYSKRYCATSLFLRPRPGQQQARGVQSRVQHNHGHNAMRSIVEDS